MIETHYDASFYEQMVDGARRSAAVLVPFVMELFPDINSVVDFGCGPGVWLAEFMRGGVNKVKGLDFGEGVPSSLCIPSDCFEHQHLGKPIRVGKFDLCISLEVAEHLGESASDPFVANLCAASDVVLFSAASPFQGGHHHVNEQWPTYWVEKFKAHGRICVDVIRPAIWNDQRTCWWYRQNAMLFLTPDKLDARLLQLASFNGADLVHPDLYFYKVAALERQTQPDSAWEQRARQAEKLVARLKSSAFWKITRPFHRISGAARSINKAVI